MIGGGGRGGKTGRAASARWADGAVVGLLLLVLAARGVAGLHASAEAGAVPPPDPAILAHRVDLSAAGEGELRLLPGVGPALAGRILEERERGGAFASLEEVARRVPGVGPVRLRWWRDRAVAGGTDSR